MKHLFQVIAAALGMVSRKLPLVGLTLLALGLNPLAAQREYFPLMIDRPREYPIQFAAATVGTEAPVIDGRIDDACWQGIDPLSAFQLTDGRRENNRWQWAGGRPARHQTRVQVLRVRDMLYLAFECDEPEMDQIRAEAVYHDEERIGFDDRICVFIDPAHDHRNVFQFVVNARGATLERPISRPVPYAMSYQIGPIEWNTEWFARVRREQKRWTGEMCIALDRLLGHPVTAGETIGFNVCRDRRPVWRFGPTFQRFEYPQECSAWAYAFNPTSGSMAVDNWYEPIMFGDLVLAPPGVEVTKVAFFQSTADYNGSNWYRSQKWGDNPLLVTVRNPSAAPRALRLEVASGAPDAPETRRAETVLAPGERRELEVAIPIRGHDDQSFTLSLRDPADERLLYRTSYTTRVPPFVEFDLADVYAPPGAAGRGIRVSAITQPGALRGLGLRMELRGAGEANLVVARDVAPLSETAVLAEAFPGFTVSSLPVGDYVIACSLRDSAGQVAGTFEQKFTRPALPGAPTFGAREDRYSFAGETGKAVRVSFPAAHDFVFWERASYAPWWDVAGVGVSYEFVECWGYGNMGCSEPMQDKENRFSRVRILESSPARVVVHWRYALTDPNYRIFRDEWVDEYYTFYPDAVGTRQVNLWANSDLVHEFIQPQYVMPPGVLPAQVFERQPARVFNLAGTVVEDDLAIPGDKKAANLDCEQWREGVMRIRLKGRPHPFYAWVRREDVWPRITRLFPAWQPPIGDVRYNLGGHWPITTLNVDVYNIVSTHRAYHTWSGFVQAKADPDQVPNTWTHLIGITDRDDSFLANVSAAWCYPARVNVDGSGWRETGYDFRQRAFVVAAEGGAAPTSLRLRLGEPRGRETFNPVFLLRGARGAVLRVKVNGTALPAHEYRAAATHRPGESVIWLGRNVPAGGQITFEFDTK
jgi:hypothetical protein